MAAAIPVVLVVDDEVQVRRLVRDAVSSDFARVVETGMGKEAIDLAESQHPSLVVLDLGLPDMSGVDVCTELRRRVDAPIVVLSGRHTAMEKDALLGAGAADYVIKPFLPAELQARVRAVMQRANPEAAPAMCAEFGDVTVDWPARMLSRAGVLVHLTPTEWALLRVLAAHPGKVLTHHQLFTEVWPSRHAGDAQQYLRVHIANLRRKIETDSMHPAFIVTEPGVGYRLDPSGGGSRPARPPLPRTRPSHR